MDADDEQVDREEGRDEAKASPKGQPEKGPGGQRESAVKHAPPGPAARAKGSAPRRGGHQPAPTAAWQPDERFFRVILDSISDGVFTVDLDWRITSFNRAAEEITRISRERAIGRKCYDVLHANICQSGCALHHSIETGVPVVAEGVNIVDAQGRSLPVRIATAVLRDGKGRVVGGVETFRDVSAIEELRKEVARRYTFEDIISKNHVIQGIFSILPDIAESDSTVLVEGPSGSGKELFARAIHNLGPRRKRPLVVVNCGALPDTLLESELFGYKAGAFTGANADKPGRIALAEGGTLFLDEVGDMSPALQVRLLRVLQEREYEPLGGTAPVKADVRVVAATNKPLADLVERRAFRQDLFFRLNVLRIRLPSLAERREDIPLLVEHFLERLGRRTGKPVPRVSGDVLELLLRYSYPGNVRELENILEHAFVLCRGGEIGRGCLPPEFLEAVEGAAPPAATQGSMVEAEVRLIREALARHGGHRGRTAAELGIDKSTLWRKIKRYNIPIP